MSLPSDPTWQSASWTPVPFVELGEEFGWERGQNDSGPYAKKPYLIAWADQNRFFQDLRGVNGLTTVNHGDWSWTGPLLYPDSPTDNIYATGISVKSVGQIVGSDPIQYTYAIVLVSFTRLTWDANQQESDPFGFNSFGQTEAEIAALAGASQELDFGYQEIPIPKSALKFASDGLAVTQHAVLRVALVVMNVTWERMPYMPLPQVQQYAGTVNNATFLGAGVGQVMFDGGKSQRQVMADGSVVQRLQMVFRYRSVSFQKMVRPDTGAWDTVQKPNGSNLFTQNDFSQLLFANAGS